MAKLTFGRKNSHDSKKVEPIMMQAVTSADIWVRPPVLPLRREPDSQAQRDMRLACTVKEGYIRVMEPKTGIAPVTAMIEPAKLAAPACQLQQLDQDS